MRSLSFAAAGCLLSLTVVACGDGGSPSPSGPARPGGELKTLVDMTNGLEVIAGGTGTFNFAGQSFVIPGTGTYTGARFHWYSFQRTPVAFGTLTLLTQEYLGLPGELGPSTPGFVARSSETRDNVYEFGDTVTLTAGTKYWVYTDTQGSFAGSFDQDTYPDGDEYLTGIKSQPFRKTRASGRMVGGVFVPGPEGVFVDANFRLQARQQ